MKKVREDGAVKEVREDGTGPCQPRLGRGKPPEDWHTEASGPGWGVDGGGQGWMVDAGIQLGAVAMTWSVTRTTAW